MRFVIALFFMVVSASSVAADKNKPHPHSGVLAPYPTTPTVKTLTAQELATLADGKSVQDQFEQEGQSSGRGFVVQDVHATPDVIWSRILSFDMYTTWVDKVQVCEEYEKTDLANGNKSMKVRFVLNAIMSVEYFISHTYYPSQSYLTWTLDYSKESDLDDSVGFWYVKALPERPGWSRIYYSVDVKFKGWIPGIIKNMVTRSGLKKATAWVKEESEKIANPQ